MGAEAAAPNLTAPQHALLAAHDLAARGDGAFRAEELAVRAWERAPRAFGLKGHRDQYPCSNTAFVLLMRHRGQLRGWLEKVGPKRYRLTAAGVKEAARLLAPPERPAPPAGGGTCLNAAARARLLARLNAPAYRKWRTARAVDITYPEAAEFWGLPAGGRPCRNPERVVNGCVGGVVNSLKAARARAAAPGGLAVAGGRVVAGAEVEALAALHEYLLGRFARELDRERTPRFRRLE